MLLPEQERDNLANKVWELRALVVASKAITEIVRMDKVIKVRALVVETPATVLVVDIKARRTVVVIIADLVLVAVVYLNPIRKLMLKQFRIRSAKRRPNFPVVVPVIKILKPNIAVTSVKKWLKSVPQLNKLTTAA
jgi:hypothetical protein